MRDYLECIGKIILVLVVVVILSIILSAVEMTTGFPMEYVILAFLVGMLLAMV